jgi:hypothetical protein
MRLQLMIVMACVLGSHVAAADGPSVWDRSYKPGSLNGGWPCPDPHQPVVIKNGHFNITWEIKIHEQYVTIAHIEGDVRPSGLTENVATHFEKFSKEVIQAMEDDSDKPDEVRKRPLSVEFETNKRGDRHFEVVIDAVSCSSSWQASSAEIKEAAASGSVDCNAGEYAVALWTKTHAFKSGEYTRVATPGQPTRLYRCVDACKAGDDPVKSHGHEETWAFFGECEGKVSAAAPLPASGSSKWDGSYHQNSGLLQQWWCPHGDKPLIVKKGKFSMPWMIKAGNGMEDGRDEDELLSIGTLDGVIAANGTVTLRPAFTVNTLPPEVTNQLDKTDAAAMAELRTVVPTMKFDADVRTKSYESKGRRALLNVGNTNDCEMNFQEKDYDVGDVSAYPVSCNSDQAWSSKQKYGHGDLATVTTGGKRTQYRCNASKDCRVGGRPGNNPEWEKSGPCQ